MGMEVIIVSFRAKRSGVEKSANTDGQLSVIDQGIPAPPLKLWRHAVDYARDDKKQNNGKNT